MNDFFRVIGCELVRVCICLCVCTMLWVDTLLLKEMKVSALFMLFEYSDELSGLGLNISQHCVIHTVYMYFQIESVFWS